MPTLRCLTAAACTLVLLTACTPASVSTDSPTPSADSTKSDSTKSDSTKSDAVMRIVREAMTQDHLKAVIVRVTVDGKEVVTEAVGESMTGVPATPAMHFRNGAVAISYVSTLLLQLAEERHGQSRRQAVDVAARGSALRPGHAASTRPDDLRIRRLRDRQHRDERRAVRRSVPRVDHP